MSEKLERISPLSSEEVFRVLKTNGIRPDPNISISVLFKKDSDGNRIPEGIRFTLWKNSLPQKKDFVEVPAYEDEILFRYKKLLESTLDQPKESQSEEKEQIHSEPKKLSKTISKNEGDWAGIFRLQKTVASIKKKNIRERKKVAPL